MTKKKINFLSGIFLTISSMLGAGIFVKTKTLNLLAHNDSWAILLLMFLGLVVVISLMMSLSIIVSGQTGDMGVLEWTQKHCPKWFNSLSINYMRSVYQPISLVLVPLYVVELMTGGLSLNIELVILGSIFFMFIFMIINRVSFQLAEKLQMCLLTVVLITLFVLPVIGFYDLLMGNGVSDGSVSGGETAKSLDGLGPWMILISGFPSFFFMYDGFYGLLSLRSKLKKPENLMKCLVIGFLLITVLYSYIILSFRLISSTGSYKDVSAVKNSVLLNGLCSFAVTCAGLLTLNAVCMSNTKMLHAAYQEYNFKDVSYIKRKLFTSKFIKNKNSIEKLSIWIYQIFKALLWYCLIGFICLMKKNKSDTLYGINESLADVTSTIIFLIISTVIINFARKIKDNKEAVPKQVRNKNMSIYIYSSYIASGIIYSSCAYIYLNCIFGVFSFNGADSFQSAFKLIVTILFFVISAFPMFRTKYKNTVNKCWYNALGVGKHPASSLSGPLKIIKLTLPTDSSTSNRTKN